MTREELDNWNVCVERPDARVMKDVIFDYFENRTCESCKYLVKNNNKSFECNNENSLIILINSNMVSLFCCNNWEPKDD